MKRRRSQKVDEEARNLLFSLCLDYDCNWKKIMNDEQIKSLGYSKATLEKEIIAEWRQFSSDFNANAQCLNIEAIKRSIDDWKVTCHKNFSFLPFPFTAQVAFRYAFCANSVPLTTALIKLQEKIDISPAIAENVRILMDENLFEVFVLVKDFLCFRDVAPNLKMLIDHDNAAVWLRNCFLLNCDRVSPDEKNYYTMRAMCAACESGLLPIVELLEHEIDFSLPSTDSTYSRKTEKLNPLYSAAAHYNVIQKLLKNSNFEMNKLSERQVHLAWAYNPTTFLESALGRSVRLGFHNSFNILVKHPDIDPTHGNPTPLFLACKYSGVDIVSELLKFEYTDSQLMDSYEAACVSGNLEVYSLFHEHPTACKIVYSRSVFLPVIQTCTADMITDVVRELIKDLKVQINLSEEVPVAQGRSTKTCLSEIRNVELAQLLFERNDLEIPDTLLWDMFSKRYPSSNASVCLFYIKHPKVNISYSENGKNIIHLLVQSVHEFHGEYQKILKGILEDFSFPDEILNFRDTDNWDYDSECCTPFQFACRTNDAAAKLMLEYPRVIIHNDVIGKTGQPTNFLNFLFRQTIRPHCPSGNIEALNFLVKDERVKVTESFAKLVVKQKIVSTAALLLVKGISLPGRLTKKFQDLVEEEVAKQKPASSLRVKSARK